MATEFNIYGKIVTVLFKPFIQFIRRETKKEIPNRETQKIINENSKKNML